MRSRGWSGLKRVTIPVENGDLRRIEDGDLRSDVASLDPPADLDGGVEEILVGRARPGVVGVVEDDHIEKPTPVVGEVQEANRAV